MAKREGGIRIPDRESLFVQLIGISDNDELLIHFYPPLLARADDVLQAEELVQLFTGAFIDLMTAIAEKRVKGPILFSVRKFVSVLMQNAPDRISFVQKRIAQEILPLILPPPAS